MSNWNFAEVWEQVAADRPDAPALVHAGRTTSWRDLDRRADAVGTWLLGLGLDRQATVAQYLHSRPEYVEALFACFKASLVPVNTNYRYGAEELVYLWTNAECAAVVFEGEYGDLIDSIRDRVPVHGWLWVDDGSGPCPAWATSYGTVASASVEPLRPERSGDDLYLLYTGGTTGMPKGVMWRQDDLFAALNRSGRVRYREEGTIDDVVPTLAASSHAPPVGLPAAPLMHGTGAFGAFGALSSGGCVATLEGRSFSAVEFLDVVERERVTESFIVGDAFAKPILRELDAHPHRWDISSLWLLVSSGVLWAAETKAGLMRHNPRLRCVDTLGSSEAVGMASSHSSSKSGATSGFTLSASTQVITEDGRFVEPGSGELGLVAMRGRTPIGCYRDAEKSAATFKIIDGVRWSIPGDWATVEADGTLRLLGRGSLCINTGGEKVYPEEVEEAVKANAAVADVVVVGVPDERFGEAVVAVVEALPGAELDESDVIAGVKAHLAHYKAPKRVVVLESLGRAANGKADYKRLRAEAIDRL
jgi:acyl-CoA synthetase (AMP-forming)/AMP-acid ligase II